MPPKKVSKKVDVSSGKVCRKCRTTILFVVLLGLFCILIYQMYVDIEPGFYISVDGGINPGDGMFPDGPPNVEPPIAPPPAN